MTMLEGILNLTCVFFSGSFTSNKHVLLSYFSHRSESKMQGELVACFMLCIGAVCSQGDPPGHPPIPPSPPPQPPPPTPVTAYPDSKHLNSYCLVTERQLKLLEGNVFSCVCPWESHVTITHDILDLTILRTPPGPTLLYTGTALNPLPRPLLVNIWWPKPESCSNLLHLRTLLVLKSRG